MTDILSKAATASEIARAVMSGKVKASAVVEAQIGRKTAERQGPASSGNIRS